MSEQLGLSSVDMTHGLGIAKKIISARLTSQRELIVIICGNQGVGKSTFLEILANTNIGGLVSPEQLMVSEEEELPAKPYSYHREPVDPRADYYFYKGIFPPFLKGKVFISTMGGGGELLRRSFPKDERFLFIGLHADKKTRGKILFDRRLRDYVDTMEDFHSSSRWIKQRVAEDTRELLLNPEYQRELSTESQLDLIIDTSIGSRIDPEYAKMLLTATEV